MDEKNTNKQLRIYDQSGKFTRVSVDEAIARNLNSWEGWTCAAGIRGLYIDYDGNVWICNTSSSKFPRFNFKAWEKIVKDNEAGPNAPEEEKRAWDIKHKKMLEEFRNSTEGYVRKISLDKKYPGFLGNIYDGYDLPKEWIKCPWNACSCGADVIMSKAKDEKTKELLSVTHRSWSGKEETVHNYVETISEPSAVEMNFPIPYQILWDLGRRCNYDCSYCWSYVHNRTDEHKDFNLLVNTTDRIINEWSKGETIRWNFGGGEPTLHPKFLDLLKHLKNKNQWTMVTSNGTRDNKYWSEAVKYLNSINLSAHFDGLLGTKEENRFIKNIEAICNHFDDHNDDHWLEIKIMSPPEHFDRALSLKTRIIEQTSILTPGANDRIKGYISMVPIRSIGDSGKLVTYTKEQLAILQNQ